MIDLKQRITDYGGVPAPLSAKVVEEEDSDKRRCHRILGGKGSIWPSRIAPLGGTLGAMMVLEPISFFPWSKPPRSFPRYSNQFALGHVVELGP